MVEEINNNFEEKIIRQIKDVKLIKEKDYPKIGVNFNPFPPAGIPRHPSLPPLDESSWEKMIQFISATYQKYETEEFGEYAGLTIAGDFGMGKTHLMQYLKYSIDNLNEKKEIDFSALTVFIDRPEDAPQKVIHRIVEQIGLSNLRKFILFIILETIQKKTPEELYKEYNSAQKTLTPFEQKEGGENGWKRLLEEPIRSNPLQFLKEFRELGGDIRKLRETAKQVIEEDIIPDEVLAARYLKLLFAGKKIDNSWEVLAGYISSKDLKNKEIQFLNSVVKILRKNGYKMLYVFIDEFEDVSKLKSGAKFSDYVRVLNTLINRERHWAVVVSLTEDALERIQENSPPLYDRLTTWKVTLRPLDKDIAKELIKNYLNLARKKLQEDISPFSETLLEEMVKASKGNYRAFIRLAHKSLRYAIDNPAAIPLKAEIIKKIEGK